MRVHEAAVLGDGSDPVGIAVGGQASVALLANYRLLQQRDMRFDRLRIDAWKQRIQLLANGDVLYIVLAENSGENAPPRTVHCVDSKFAFRLRDQAKVGEAPGSGS